MNIQTDVAKIFNFAEHQLLITRTYENDTDDGEDCFKVGFTIVGNQGHEMTLNMNIPIEHSERMDEIWQDITKETAEDMLNKLTSESLYRLIQDED